MREIKFRGLKKDGTWIYGSLVETTRFIKHMPHCHTKYWIVRNAFGNGGWFNLRDRDHVKTESVGQYTGVKDNTGREVYEGDIIFTKQSMRNGRFFPSRKAVVYFDEDAQQYFPKELSEREVIGNIHENPELIKGE
jgi:hypothetical protein